MSDEDFKQAALEYHRMAPHGKIKVSATKPMVTQRDLALAYSPGVAHACEAIVAYPAQASTLTARGNLVAVISNGTAVLGLGNIGPLAGKPVMEGKGVLFKKFAGVDVFDIELNENDPDKLVDIICSMEPTFGGINLEDIKAPECFYIEKKCRERMNIPVFHDDQHGTAIVAAAAVLNSLRLVNKDIGSVRVVTSGAGAAAIACLDLLVALGVKRENITVCDSKGVIFQGRDEKMDESKLRFAIPDNGQRKLADAMVGADIFMGLSGPKLVTQDMVKSMAAYPVILAMANPEPEILPPLVKEVRPDAIIGTGRSDYPNQVNNVLCFPFIFRGALACGATKITEGMKLACVREIAALAKAETSDEVAAAYAGQELAFGPDYLIPKPFDARLILRIAPAVAAAAAAAGVATRPVEDLAAYRQSLERYVYQTGMFMRPVFAAAKAAPARVVYAEGEDERVLRAVQVVLDEGLAKPIQIGRPAVIAQRVVRSGLRLKGRDGVSPDAAKAAVRRSTTLISTLLLKRGDADAMLCGLHGRYDTHFDYVRSVIGARPGVHTMATMNALMLEEHNLFITDTFINEQPSAEELAEIALMAAEEVRRFGLPPKVA